MSGPIVEATTDAAPAVGTTEVVEGDDRVRCRRCRTPLTRGRMAVVRSGEHEHTFRNPAGYSWTLACYRDAPGCRATGGLTSEATWFAGYEWCHAICSGCARHVGWWFVASGSRFVGLVVTRITR